MLRNPSLLVRPLAALCTCSLLLFLIAASAVGEFASTARVGYFGVYLTGAALCFIASQVARAHIVRWQWLSPAIGSIPTAIVAGWWSISASDLIALLFYPFAMLTVVRPSGRLDAAWRYHWLDVLVVSGAALTGVVYLSLHGATQASLYRLIAPAAAVAFVVPTMIGTSITRDRRSDAGLSFFIAGLILALVTDITPATIPYSGFTWAVAVWLMAVGATVASTHARIGESTQQVTSSLPRGWWPTAAVAGVYAFIVPELRRIDSIDTRLLLIGGTVLTTFLVVRQFVAMRENDDLVDRRRIEEARFRALVQQSPDGFAIVDVEGRHQYISPGLRQLVSHTDTECHGSRFVDLFPSHAKSAIMGTLSHVSQEVGRSHSIAITIRSLDGRPRHLEFASVNRTNEPAINGIVLTIRDITERVQLERHLAQHEKTDTVARIAGGVAHDFKNLLTVIMGNVDEISVTAKQEIASDRFDEIRHAVTRAAELSRSLLGVSRQRAAASTTVDINALIQRIRGIVQSGIGPEYEIELRLSHLLWPVNADAQDLEHALLNLALNARDAMPDGGILRIATANVHAAELTASSALPGQDYVRLTVEDTGVGMSEEVMAHAFEPFFSTKPEGRGSGLGLALVSAAMRRIGGFVEVSSVLGGGTTVHLFLPRERSVTNN